MSEQARIKSIIMERIKSYCAQRAMESMTPGISPTPLEEAVDGMVEAILNKSPEDVKLDAPPPRT